MDFSRRATCAGESQITLPDGYKPEPLIASLKILRVWHIFKGEA